MIDLSRIHDRYKSDTARLCIKLMLAKAVNEDGGVDPRNLVMITLSELDAIRGVEEKGYIEIRDSSVWLTLRGKLIANSCLSRLMRDVREEQEERGVSPDI